MFDFPNRRLLMVRWSKPQEGSEYRRRSDNHGAIQEEYYSITRVSTLGGGGSD